MSQVPCLMPNFGGELNMRVRNIIFLALTMAFILSVVSAQAEEPTWLFTVPKAQTIKEGNFDIGFLYFDFGVIENLELGIHGIKYQIPNSDLAVGYSFLPMNSPYLVFSPDIGEAELNVGFKANPYYFFGGLEFPISKDLKFIAELNNGLDAGVRIFPTKNLTIDLFMYFSRYKIYELNYYGYKYRKIVIEDYRAYPGFWIVYSGRFK